MDDQDLIELEELDDECHLPALVRPVEARASHPIFTRIPAAAAHSPEWYALRAKGIGASEAAAACGVSRWSNPIKLWLRKTGRLTEETSMTAKRGTLIERSVARMLVEEFELQVHRFAPGMYFHETEDYVFASPDGILADARGLEIKATSVWDDIGESGTDEVPMDWIFQTQQQCACCDFESVVLGAFLTINDVRIFEVHRSQILIDKILAREFELWTMVQEGINPPLEWLESTSYDLLRAGFKEIRNGVCCVISKASAEKWYEAERLLAQASHLLKRAKALKAPAVLEMAESQWGSLPCGKRLKRSEVRGSIQIRKVRGSYDQR